MSEPSDWTTWGEEFAFQLASAQREIQLMREEAQIAGDADGVAEADRQLGRLCKRVDDKRHELIRREAGKMTEEER